MKESTEQENIPLYVDLDGSLIYSDSFWESFIMLLRERPLSLLLSPLWILKGRAHFKRQVTDRVIPEARSFRYNKEVEEYARSESERRKVILATGTDDRIAKKVFDHFGFFDSIIASDGLTNTISQAKLELINQDCDGTPFEYLGNSSADMAVWAGAAGAAVVHSSEDFVDKVRSLTTVTRVFKIEKEGGFSSILRAMRIHQWVKNLLIFVPLFLAHQFLDFGLFVSVLAAFLSFSLSASAVYLLNDLIDLPNDRRHPDKSRRPIASGQLSLPKASVLVPVLLILSGSVAIFALPVKFLAVLAIYLLTTSLYSFVLKRINFLDVAILAGLYAIRLWAGSVATDVPLSEWLIAFSVLFFLSLAMAKRYGELKQLQDAKMEASANRNYDFSHMKSMKNAGPAFGTLSLIILPFYIFSDSVSELYSHPHYLWALIFVLFLWLTRIWSSTLMGRMNSDPVVFMLKDWLSWIWVVAGIAVVYFST